VRPAGRGPASVARTVRLNAPRRRTVRRQGPPYQGDGEIGPLPWRGRPRPGPGGAGRFGGYGRRIWVRAKKPVLRAARSGFTPRTWPIEWRQRAVTRGVR